MNKKKIMKKVLGFEISLLSVGIGISSLFWFNFLLHLFLKEFFVEASYETHNAFVQLIYSNPLFIMLCVMLPGWILILYILYSINEKWRNQNEVFKKRTKTLQHL